MLDLQTNTNEAKMMNKTVPNYMKILKIAITGSAGSGKSLVCQRLGQKGVVTLDCDHIARTVVEPNMPGFAKIVELCGKKVIQKNGTLDRARLRTIIVNDVKMRRKIENILHPQILGEMVSQMNTAESEGNKTVAVEVPLLFETGMDKQFDITIVVTAQNHDLVKRISDRDNVNKTDAGKMLDLQMPQAEKIKRADYCIDNNGSLPELFDSVDNLLNKIQKEFLTT